MSVRIVYLLRSALICCLCCCGSVAMLPKTPLDPRVPEVARILRDLQGNILQDHGRLFAKHIFLQLGSNPGMSRDFIRSLADQVTSAFDELQKDPEKLFQSVLFSVSAYRKLDLDTDKKPYDQAFRLGMQDLATEITVDPQLEDVANPCADPPIETWDHPFPIAVPDVLVILGLSGKNATHKLDMAAKTMEQVASSHQVKVLASYDSYRMKTNDGLDMEHFGFADGVSNPLFLDEDYQAAVNQTTTGKFVHGADPLSPLQLVIRKDHFGLPHSFGSYVAYRRLEQNVDRFQEYGRNIRKALQEKGVTITQDEAEARMMGRNKNGVPLVADLSGVKPEYRTSAINFNYDKDKDGAQCPLSSHIRKINPRGLDVAGDNDVLNKVVRRAMAYGALPNQPGTKGLLFLCYQGSLNVGFLTQQHSWANSISFPYPLPRTDGIGMVVGQYYRDSPPIVNQTVFSSPKVSMLIKDCVTMKGGEYFFVPSISTLKRIQQL